MNGTPRLRSGAFPQTPDTARRAPYDDGSPGGKPMRVRAPLTDINIMNKNPADDGTQPLISTDVIPAPTQRLYAFFFYGALAAWRAYDFINLHTEEADSLWLFMKWVMIDGLFLFGLPVLRIPWLEWSPPTMVFLFLVHALLDGMLMFRIGIPITAWLGGLFKLVYDREPAIEEHYVDPWTVLHNESLILGKQVIHILPEGSAVLNPDKDSFCLGGFTKEIKVPIQINQTTPMLIEIARFDLDNGQNETISLSQKQVKNLVKEAKKAKKTHLPEEPLLLLPTFKKTGYYRLNRVVDESKLEVQTRVSEAMVVSCPEARIKPSSKTRCKGESADIGIVVTGTPPLQLKYRRMVEGRERESKSEFLQPDDYISPLSRSSVSDALIRTGQVDVSWARAHSIEVSLSDALSQSGLWAYSVDEVSDALGNVIQYSTHIDEGETPKLDEKLQRAFFVYERPTINLHGCDSQHPLRVAKGQKAPLPIRFSSTAANRKALSDSQHTVEYMFTPEEELSSDGEHTAANRTKIEVLKSAGQKITIQKSGLYTLKSVSTDTCAGEVEEPASCLLLNPPEPDLDIASAPIFDKCANRPLGLRVNLDLIGTPPFKVAYSMRKKGEKGEQVQYVDVTGLRGQVDIMPPEAGHYTYSFTSVSDQVYKGLSLTRKNLVLEQDVKPSASAHFVYAPAKTEACIDEPVTFGVKMQGEGPWTLEYELVHARKRVKKEITGIETETFTITTDPLDQGGEYTLALASVTDAVGCKEFLKEEAKISVRHERPKGYFGQIEGRRSLRTLEGKKVALPLRLTGKGPWDVKYKNAEDPDDYVHTRKLSNANDFLDANGKGLYELLDVRDAICPGSVDPAAKIFEVSLIPRPTLRIPETTTITYSGDKYIRQEICEGDQDSLDVALTGSPPYTIKYEHHAPGSGYQVKAVNAALNIASVAMDTSKAGVHQYKFTELADNNYDHNARTFQQLKVEQLVNPRPSAKFKNPGKTYSYCTSEEDGEEVIPIEFTGLPPFHLEVNLKHAGSSKAETLSFPNIPSTSHNIKIPHRHLHLGMSSLTIRKVRDARGCRDKPALSSASRDAPRVQIAVHNAPSIAPLDTRTDFCVGDRLSYALAGAVPFSVFYTFNGASLKAISQGTTFRRLAEKPGAFAITGVADSASHCRANSHLAATIHEMPSVRVSRGKETRVDIHEGGEAEILFEFGGTPPFEFTYTRSTNARPGQRSRVLETRTLTSGEYSMRIKASEEGTYEVISIRDAWCSFSKNPDGSSSWGKEERKAIKGGAQGRLAY
ncbi:nucleoporin pom152 [Botryosphaeria dothidea]|uniref:Nucleoporin pom152 n=1 Tax=Botryosphaeria dothidea TaxID=55169 RepID=A0A8H4N6P5_9PEZI|nr:nucleoporin pom152 [Botryosphaeria dothidea]